MIKHLFMSVMVGLLGIASQASAEISALNNRELAATVVENQPDQLQPVLPEQKSNGQIGGVEVAALPQAVPAIPSSINVSSSTLPSQQDLEMRLLINALLANQQLHNNPALMNQGR